MPIFPSILTPFHMPISRQRLLSVSATVKFFTLYRCGLKHRSWNRTRMVRKGMLVAARVAGQEHLKAVYPKLRIILLVELSRNGSYYRQKRRQLTDCLCLWHIEC